MFKPKILNKRTVIAGLSLAIFILGLLFFYNAGTWLVKEDKLHKADAIFVLMGSIGDRLATTNDLYLGGISQKIIMVNDFVPGNDLPALKGNKIPSNARSMRTLAIKIGIPDSVITILPGSANSTIDEAKIISDYLSLHPGTDTIAIVSSASHTKRASIIFNSMLKNKHLSIHIIMCPSPYSAFHAENWWQNRDSAKAVVLEYAKLLYFCLYEKYI